MNSNFFFRAAFEVPPKDCSLINDQRVRPKRLWLVVVCVVKLEPQGIYGPVLVATSSWSCLFIS